MAGLPPLFNFFTYASNLTEMLDDEFDALQEVSFPPTAEGFTDSRFADVALPAFLVNFENPELNILGFDWSRMSEDIEDEKSYRMPMTLKLAGYLLLPVYPEQNDEVPNVNATVALAQAASNIAAKIYAHAKGWNCGVATINEINFIDDSATDEERNYHVGEIHWSHEIWVGAEPGVTFVDPLQVFNRFTIPVDGETPDESYEVYPDRGEAEP